MVKNSDLKGEKRKKEKSKDSQGDDDSFHRKKAKKDDKRQEDGKERYVTTPNEFQRGLHDESENCSDAKDSKKEPKKRKKYRADNPQLTLDSGGEQHQVGPCDDDKSANSSERVLEGDSNEELGSLCSKQSKEAEKDGRKKKKKMKRAKESCFNERGGKWLFGENIPTKEEIESGEKTKRTEKEQLVQENVETCIKNIEEEGVAKIKNKKKKKQELNNSNDTDEENSEMQDLQSLSSEETDNVKKKKKKKKKKEKQESEEEKEPLVHPAVDYLLTWYNDRKNWNFKKVRQVWLLHNIFDHEQISDENFCILLKYLEGLKGAAKTKTIDMAEKRLENATGTDEQKAVVEARVRQLLQMLSE